MRGIAIALNGNMDAFEGNVAGDLFWVFHIIGYPVFHQANGKGTPDNDVGCRAHTDYGLLTLINQDDDITALQPRNSNGEWISAVPIPGTFVCNIGDMLKICMHYHSHLQHCLSICYNLQTMGVCVYYNCIP